MSFRGLFYIVVLVIGVVCLVHALGHDLGWYALPVGGALGTIGDWMARVERKP